MEIVQIVFQMNKSFISLIKATENMYYDEIYSFLKYMSVEKEMNEIVCLRPYALADEG